VLARRLCPAHRRDEVEADLRDLFSRTRAERGESAARLRYWLEVLAIAGWRARERVRDGWARPPRRADPRRLTELLTRNLELGLRAARRRPTVTAIAVVSMALGISVNVAVFTILNAALLRPLGVPGEASLTFLANPTLSYAQQRALRDAIPSMDVFAFRFVPGVELGEGGPPLPAEVVDADYFDALRLSPAAGRWFVTEDAFGSQRERAVVLGESLWRSRFGSDPEVVGSVLPMGVIGARVVGIAPRGFRGLAPHTPADLWIVANGHREEELQSSDWMAVVRVPDGMATGEASARLQTATRGLEGLDPEAPVNALDRPRLLRLMWLVVAAMMLMPGLVLVVACANVSGLLAARAEERRGEMAVRRALGGSRARLVAQLLAEGSVLALGGAALGLAMGRWTVDGLAPWLLPLLARYSLHPDLGLDSRAVVASLLAAGVATLASSLLPAWSAARQDLTPLLNERPIAWRAGRRRVGFRDVLVLGQLVVTFAFVASALVCARGLRRTASVAFGFDPERVLVATVVQPDLPPSPGLLNRVTQRVSRVAGVRQVSLASAPPAVPGPTVPVRVRGLEEEARALLNRVQPGYFEIIGSELLRGRLLDAVDVRLDRSVAVVSASTARRLWKDREVLGESIRFGDGAPPLEVVGIVADPVEVATLTEPRARPRRDGLVYAPLGPKALLQGHHPVLVVGTFGSAGDVASEVARATREVAPDTALTGARSVAEMNRAGTIHAEVASVFSILLGVLSSVLGGIGIYGAIAHLVARRKPEIGLRMTLGASPADVRRMVLRRGLGLAILGCALGVPAAFAMTRVLASAVAELPGLDTGSLIIATASILTASWAASYCPAGRAIEVDPVSTLRAH